MFIILYCFWLILNGRMTLEICLIGLPVCIAVFLFCTKYLDYSIKKELRLYQSVPFFIKYILVLIKEIVKANVQVLRVVVFAPKSIQPVRVRFRVPLKSKVARVMLANSITLTPGTITATLDNDEYLVHCLTKDMAEGIETSVFVTLLQEWERKW